MGGFGMSMAALDCTEPPATTVVFSMKSAKTLPLADILPPPCMPRLMITSPPAMELLPLRGKGVERIGDEYFAQTDGKIEAKNGSK